MTILVVEDEQSIADTLIFSLKQEGFSVEHVLLGSLAIEKVKTLDIELLILDIGLPDLSGFEVCKAVRSFSQVPILFLSARDSEIDKVVGLEIGGDDYVTKPFSPREVAARVKVILRRLTPEVIENNPEKAFHTSSLETKTSEPQKTQLAAKEGLFQHLSDQKQFIFMGQALTLTPYEYGLMCEFFNQPKRVFSRDQLLDAVWPEHCGSLDRVVDTHIKSLRAKLKEIHPEGEFIKTHRSLGYSLQL